MPFDIQVTEAMLERQDRRRAPRIISPAAREIDYATYARYRGKMAMK